MINVGEGGIINLKGIMEYQVEKLISIMVILESEYEFIGWIIIGGDVIIENLGSLIIIVILYGFNSIIIVNFK